MAMVCSVSDGYPMVGLSSLQHVLTFYVKLPWLVCDCTSTCLLCYLEPYRWRAGRCERLIVVFVQHPPASIPTHDQHDKRQQSSALLRRRQRRVTFLVNIWLNHKSLNVKPFPESMLDKLTKPIEDYVMFKKDDDDDNNKNGSSATMVQLPVDCSLGGSGTTTTTTTTTTKLVQKIVGIR